jgi:hypothetical protein
MFNPNSTANEFADCNAVELVTEEGNADEGNTRVNDLRKICNFKRYFGSTQILGCPKSSRNFENNGLKHIKTGLCLANYDEFDSTTPSHH